MKELYEYRARLIERLVSAAEEFRETCLKVRDPHAPLNNGWSVHQIAVHTRDVDKMVYGLRVRRTAHEENPEFANFDGDAYMAEHYDPNEPLNEILNEFVMGVNSLAELLRALPVEAWSRESRHARLGSGLTLQSWVERSLAHILEHLEEVRKALPRQE
ncbi:MAG TPA: DinB family protein [Anaerolineales bacterium]|nr:DinB family protein [Anaerolineales bacterium]